MKRLSPKEKIDFVAAHPKLSAQQLAKKMGCGDEAVYSIRRKLSGRKAGEPIKHEWQRRTPEQRAAVRKEAEEIAIAILRDVF